MVDFIKKFDRKMDIKLLEILIQINNKFFIFPSLIDKKESGSGCLYEFIKTPIINDIFSDSFVDFVLFSGS